MDPGEFREFVRSLFARSRTDFDGCPQLTQGLLRDEGRAMAIAGQFYGGDAVVTDFDESVYRCLQVQVPGPEEAVMVDSGGAVVQMQIRSFCRVLTDHALDRKISGGDEMA